MKIGLDFLLGFALDWIGYGLDTIMTSPNFFQNTGLNVAELSQNLKIGTEYFFYVRLIKSFLTFMNKIIFSFFSTTYSSAAERCDFKGTVQQLNFGLFEIFFFTALARHIWKTIKSTKEQFLHRFWG